MLAAGSVGVPAAAVGVPGAVVGAVEGAVEGAVCAGAGEAPIVATTAEEAGAEARFEDAQAVRHSPRSDAVMRMARVNRAPDVDVNAFWYRARRRP